MWIWALAAHATTVCVGPGPNCLDALADALADPAVDTVEISGTHTGPFTVDRDITLVGIEDAVLRLDLLSANGPVLHATGALTLRDLALNAHGWDQNLRVVGTEVVLDGVVFTDGTAGPVRSGCVTVTADTLVMTGSVVRGCFHRGEGAGLWAEAGVVSLSDTLFQGNDAPAVQIVGSDFADLDGLVVRDNGEPGQGRAGGVHLIDVEALSVTRSWFCDNVGTGGGALRVERGCTGDCRIEHDVFQGNRARLGGAVGWSGAGGLVAHSTFVGNSAAVTGRAVAVGGGHVDIDTSLIVEPSPDLVSSSFPGSTLDTDGEGTLTLSGSALYAPGTPPDGNLVLRDPPAFFAGWVAPACGESVTVDPTVAASAPLVRWPDEAAIGALTTPDCGPWCDDADADGVPAMWDCAPADPERGTGLEELGEDGVDQDCDGRDVCWTDADGDGFGTDPIAIALGDSCPGEVRRGGDCDDGDPAVHPEASERPADGTDTDCDQTELCYADADADGRTGRDLTPGDLACAGRGLANEDQGDCDDADPERRDTWCAIRVGGGCSTSVPTAGWLGALVCLATRRRRRGCATGRH